MAPARYRATPPRSLSTSSLGFLSQMKKNCDPSEYYKNHLTTNTSSLIQSLSRCHKFGRAWDVFESMKKHGIQTLESDFTILIKHYCEAGKHIRAIYAIERMTSFGVSPSSNTYDTLLTHLLYHEKADLAIGVCRRMILKFVQAGEMENAMSTLDEVKAKSLAIDVVTLNALIHGFSKAMNMNKCLEVVAYMMDMGITPNFMTHRHIIRGFCAIGRLEDAIAHLKNMKDNGVKPDIVIYSALINCFCNLGRIDEGCVFLNGLLMKGIIIDYSLIYSILVSAYCKDGKLEEACILSHKMLSHSHKILESAQSLIMLELCEFRKFEEARYFNDLIEKKKYRPEVTSLIATASTPMIFKRESIKDEILHFFSTMVSKGYMVNTFQLHSESGHNTFHMIPKKQAQVIIASYTSLLKRLCGEKRADYAYQIFREMLDNGLELDAMTYNLMISGANKMGDATITMDVFSCMRKKGFETEPYMYNQLIHSLCRVGRVDDALHVFNDTKSCRKVQDHAVYTTMIIGLCKLHKVGEACEIFFDMVEEGYKPHHTDITALFPSHYEGERSSDIKVYLPLFQNLQGQGKLTIVSRIWEMMQNKGIFTWVGI